MTACVASSGAIRPGPMHERRLTRHGSAALAFSSVAVPNDGASARASA